MTRETGAYRPDIDGLRAVAVMSVILYHLGVMIPASGFAGVDVFFVISGYLIGGIVLRARAAGTFSYRAFYARRVRRILPALCAVIVVCIPFAWAVMTPHQLRYFGGGVVATLLFVSNLWFFERIDYFNPDAELDPLLHTWSLGVEEQFYLIFPVIVGLLARRWRRALLPVLGGLFAASLALALTKSDTFPTQAFYLLQYRFWELLAGVLAFALQDRARVLAGRACGVLATAGLLLVLGGLAMIPMGGGWPGEATLVPVFGATLVVLFGGGPSVAQAVLASPPLRGIGLISYSAYLIQNPLLGFLELSGNAVSSLPAMAGVVVLILILSALSWRFVEQPFRRSGPLPRPLRRGLTAVTCLLAFFAVGGHFTKGYPQRLPAEARTILDYANSRSPTHNKCTLGRTEARRLNPETACVDNPDAPGPEVVLWGDSHMSTVAYQLAKAFPEVRRRQFPLGGCPPIPDIINIEQQTNRPVRMTDGCARFNKTLLNYILSRDDIGVVVLYAYWANYTQRATFNAGPDNILPDSVYSVPVSGAEGLTEDARQTYLQDQFRGVVQALVDDGKRVLIVDPLPIAGENLPERAARIVWNTGVVPNRISYPLAVFRDHAASARAVLDAAPTGPAVRRIDFSDAFCTEAQGCVIFETGVPFFFDTSHLSQPGVARVVPRMAEAIRDLQAQAMAETR